jgi:predicted nucleic acid-binding protein
VITLDTSGLIAYINAGDDAHQACLETLDNDPGPYIIPAGILAEIAWMLEARFSPDIEQAFLDALRVRSFILDWDEADIDRGQELTRRYQDLELGLADALVIACAERNRGRVLTTDHRHFPVIAREGTVTVLPGL